MLDVPVIVLSLGLGWLLYRRNLTYIEMKYQLQLLLRIKLKHVVAGKMLIQLIDMSAQLELEAEGIISKDEDMISITCRYLCQQLVDGGQTLVGACHDCVRLWDINTGEETSRNILGWLIICTCVEFWDGFFKFK